MDGNGLRQTSSPSTPGGSASPESSTTSMSRPRPGRWISPRRTGEVGSPATRQPHRSVPPEIEAKCTSALTLEYTQSNPSAASVEPVEVMVRRDDRSWVAPGRMPALLQASTNFADVPNRVMPVSSIRSKRRSGPGCAGEPSYSTAAAPQASVDASQFHIIQPVVVK